MEKTEVINSLFPIQTGLHVFLALLSILIFGMQFIRYRKKHYLVLAIAFPCTLLPYIAQDNMILFNAVGVFEFIALFVSLLLSLTVDREKKPKNLDMQQDENKQAQTQEEDS